MPNARYEVGENEKHNFTVTWETASKHITIEQDGVIVANEGHWYSPLPKKFQFDIGGSEPHRIEITAGPFQPIELKVDGKTVRPLL